MSEWRTAKTFLAGMGLACFGLALSGLAVSLPLNRAFAADIEVLPGVGTLARAIRSARDGDRLVLQSGEYLGPVVVDKPIAIVGANTNPEAGGKKPHVDGMGKGSVFLVTSKDVTIGGLKISGSGSSHDEIDSGVKLVTGADRAHIFDNDLIKNLYGVDIHGARDAIVEGNTITGRTGRKMNERGNGVYVWNAPGSKVINNTIGLGRDGIFANASKRNVFSGNRFETLRFAIHYMYTNDCDVEDNISIGNHLGFAIMFSNRIRLRNNISIDDRDYGIMLNYANNADIEGNTVVGGKRKCLFVYNANKNTIADNRFENCPIGIHFTGGSERNSISGNSFVQNRTQIKFVSTRDHVWRGNYWSNHAAYDVNGDGIADQAFRPNDTMDRILWTQPSAKLLLGSPAVQLVRWAQRNFPSLLPGGIVDDRPLMKPRPLPRLPQKMPMPNKGAETPEEGANG